MLAQLLLLLQGLQNAGEELGILTAQFTQGLAASRSQAVLFTRCLETFLVHIQALFAGDIA